MTSPDWRALLVLESALVDLQRDVHAESAMTDHSGRRAAAADRRPGGDRRGPLAAAGDPAPAAAAAVTCVARSAHIQGRSRGPTGRIRARGLPDGPGAAAMSGAGQAGTVYLLHFDHPYKHARCCPMWRRSRLHAREVAL